MPVPSPGAAIKISPWLPPCRSAVEQLRAQVGHRRGPDPFESAWFFERSIVALLSPELPRIT